MKLELSLDEAKALSKQLRKDIITNLRPFLSKAEEKWRDARIFKPELADQLLEKVRSLRTELSHLEEIVKKLTRILEPVTTEHIT